MLRKILLLAFSLSSCASLPQKPSIELGIIDYPSGEVITNMTGSLSFSYITSIEKASYENVAKAIVSGGGRVPLSSYDRAICFKPDYWGIEVEYIHSLERYIQNNCSAK